MEPSGSFLGITGYSPRHVEANADLTTEDRSRLRELVGQRLNRAWAVWDTTEDEWFVDAPIASGSRCRRALTAPERAKPERLRATTGLRSVSLGTSP